MSDGFKNYITPAGYRRLLEELTHLWKVERPAMVTTVAWAAGNGDRSENGDYIYGKKRLREIDRRLRYLSKSLDSAVVVDNAGKRPDRVFFGATLPTSVRAASSGRSPSSAATSSTAAAPACPGVPRWPTRCSRRAWATR
jgi:transcription elongation GreA/GreB family factor